MLSPPLTPTDCTDSSCQWKQTKSSLMSYQHGTAEHDSYRVATNRKAHDQQHDHPVSAAVIKKSRTDRTNRNKSFIQSYRRFHAMSPIRPQPYITDIRRTTKNPYHRKSIKVHRSPSPNADSMNIFVLDIYESLLRDSSQLVHSIQPPLQHTGLTDVVSHDSSPAPVMSRKNKTNVANSASYDAIDIETDDSAIFSDDWIPKQDALHDKHVKIVWKGKLFCRVNNKIAGGARNKEMAIKSLVSWLAEQKLQFTPALTDLTLKHPLCIYALDSLFVSTFAFMESRRATKN